MGESLGGRGGRGEFSPPRERGTRGWGKAGQMQGGMGRSPFTLVDLILIAGPFRSP